MTISETNSVVGEFGETEVTLVVRVGKKSHKIIMNESSERVPHMNFEF